MVSIKRFISISIKKIIIMFLVLSMLTFKVPDNIYVDVKALDEDLIEPQALIPEDSNPNFIIQHYFYFDKVKTESSAANDNYIAFINSSEGTPGEVPNVKNSKNNILDGIPKVNSPKLSYVPLSANDKLSDSRYELVTTRELIKLFEDEPTDYISNPQIPYMNRLYNSKIDYNSDFTLKEIWVYQPNDDGTSKETSKLVDSDFIKYPVPLNSTGDKHEPEKMRFTNNPNNSHITDVINNVPVVDIATDDYPYYYTILIQKNTVIRLVFDTTTGEINEDANFFDYDITDGYIYTKANTSTTNRHNTSEQTNTATWYANVYNAGINNDSLYSGTGAKYAFGNSDSIAYNGKNDEKWNNIFINKSNGSASYSGIAFDLVKGFSYNDNNNPMPVWSNGIIAPPIFDDTKDVKGKTDYTNGKNNGYKIGFYRQGTTYTLDKVTDSKNNVMLKDLRGLLVTAFGWSSKKPIFSNEFWPLDKSASYGTDGHDFKFGNNSYSEQRKFFGLDKVTKAPVSDKSGDHNSYFGMTYSVDFTVYPGYTAPLDYWFYGDDDMWVFLSKVDENGNVVSGSEKKIMDIGGVHSATGVYSNLWEYLDYNPLFNAAGTENTKAQKYRLTMFYTERGASGSSCYMKFAIPLSTNESVAPERNEAIMIEKSYVDYDGTENKYDADSEQFHFLLTMTNESGISYEDIYDYAIYRKDTTPNHLDSNAKPIETGVIGLVNPISGKYEFYLRSGEYIVISNLPENTHYTIEEIGSDSYETYYQVGTHKHINNQQVDTLNSKTINMDVNNVIRYDSKVVNYIKFTNAPLSYKDFSFEKVDVQNLTPLQSAKFNIYEYLCADMSDDSLVNIKSPSSCWRLYGNATSDENGLVTFKNIYRNKRYRLVETKAPDEYQLPIGQWNIDVSTDLKFTITAVGEEYPLAFIEDNNKLLLPNIKEFTVPETGSINSLLYTVFGTLLIGMGVIFSIYLNRKRINN